MIGGERVVDLEEKVVLVTGAGAGIGRAVALRLAREGAAVVVADVDEDAGMGTVREIRSRRGRAAFVLADVVSEAEVSGMVAFAEGEFGGLDVLVNNAGGVEEPYFPEGDTVHWGRTIDLNLRGTMLGIHFGFRAMERRGGGAVGCSRQLHLSRMGRHPGLPSHPRPNDTAGAEGAGPTSTSSTRGNSRRRRDVRRGRIDGGPRDDLGRRSSLAARAPRCTVLTP